jgi:L-2-hydroxyglutarate oxidase LhgO
MVIGAGVIGLATARALALAGRSVVILERERHFGSQMSSRNSEVIHAGIYYAPDSLKARTCILGRRLLYDYCRDHDVAFRRCGKLIVAVTDAQGAALSSIEARALANGVTDLERLDANEARRLEPNLTCVAALNSPSTGIIDSHGFMLSLLAQAEARGAQIAFGAAASRLRPTPPGVEVFIDGEPLPVLRARAVVNAAGLEAHRLARSIEGLTAGCIPEIRYAKGNYFALAGKAPFNRLIYPLPEPGGLGIHMSLDLAGRARFGPDVEWISDIGYAVDVQRAASFYAAIRRYWPALADGQLSPAYSGIRPKLSGPGEAAADFCISGPADHGIAGVVNLFGMESPGLTASLAIAAQVTEMIVDAD